MTQQAYEDAAWRYEQVAGELERAVQHLRTTARHFREGELPRALAHGWAARGHVVVAEHALDELAVLHASKSVAD